MDVEQGCFSPDSGTGSSASFPPLVVLLFVVTEGGTPETPARLELLSCGPPRRSAHCPRRHGTCCWGAPQMEAQPTRRPWHSTARSLSTGKKGSALVLQGGLRARLHEIATVLRFWEHCPASLMDGCSLGLTTLS